MKRAARLVWALAVVCVVSFGVTLLAQQPAAAPAAKPKYVEPVRGTAVINVLKPVTKVKGTEVITSLSVKNASLGPIAGLKVDEYLVRQGRERRHRRHPADEEAVAARGDLRLRDARSEGSADEPEQLPVQPRQRQGADRVRAEVLAIPTRAGRFRRPVRDDLDSAVRSVLAPAIVRARVLPGQEYARVISHPAARCSSLCLALAAAVAPRAATPPSAVATDTRDWIPAAHAARPVVKGSALDMSFLLDAPAGKHGFVTVKGDRFVFEDGTPARFWGGNFFGEANFPEKADAERLADIVARSGANIVRMHHLDVVAPWTDKVVARSLFGGQQPRTTRRLDPKMLDRFEYLVWCFKTRGVYIYLSPVSSRMPMPGDGFPGPADAVKDIGLGLKFEGMFDDFLIGLQREYLRQLLGHVNPYTGLPLTRDPVLAMTEVINENTTIWPQAHGDFAIESDYYRTMLRKQFNQWLRGMVGSRATLAAKWAADGRTGLAPGEDPAAGYGGDSRDLPRHGRARLQRRARHRHLPLPRRGAGPLLHPHAAVLQAGRPARAARRQQPLDDGPDRPAAERGVRVRRSAPVPGRIPRAATTTRPGSGSTRRRWSAKPTAAPSAPWRAGASPASPTRCRNGTTACRTRSGPRVRC